MSLADLSGRRLYLDTNVLIYAIERVPGVEETLDALIRSIDAGVVSAVTSELSIAECLVMPLRHSDPRAVEAYQRLLQSRDFFEVVPIDRELLIASAQLRAETSIRLPDAIHVATARRSGCDAFVTNDSRIPGRYIEVVRVVELTS